MNSKSLVSTRTALAATITLAALVAPGMAYSQTPSPGTPRKIFLPVVNRPDQPAQLNNCHVHAGVQYCHDGPVDHVDLDSTKLSAEDYARIAEQSIRETKANAERVTRERIASGDSADNATIGAWTTPRIWKDASNADVPIVGIFMSLLPDGKVLIWDTTPGHTGGSQDNTQAMVYDPATDRVVRRDVTPTTPGGGGANLFCAGYAKLPDGNVFVAGGNKDQLTLGIRRTYLFNSAAQTWARTADMRPESERWYPSVAPLANGEMLILGGLKESALPEVRQTNGAIRALTNISTTIGAEPRLWRNRWYPFVQVRPNGQVAYLGPDDYIGSIDTVSAGTWISATGGPIGEGKRDGIFRDYGSYVLHDAVNGKALVNGGESSKKTGAIVDLNNMTGSAAAPMTYGRRQHQLVALPNGKVLAIGGIQNYNGLVDQSDLGLVSLVPTRTVLTAELWSPAIGGTGPGSWQLMAKQTTPRQYHSSALLLPDGRILSAGGGKCGPCETPPSGQPVYVKYDYEFYSPPYLFNSGGGAATRPVIDFTPAEFGYAQTINVIVGGSPNVPTITTASLIRLGSNTHGVDFEQRYIALTFTPTGNNLAVTTPVNANIAPPGYYMLFIVNSAGVPSIAKIVRVRDGAPSATVTPTPTPPGPTLTPSPTLVPPSPTPTQTPSAPSPTPTPTATLTPGDPSPTPSATPTLTAGWQGRVYVPVAIKANP